jgi:Spy/CpxP family protein refolding chaperone
MSPTRWRYRRLLILALAFAATPAFASSWPGGMGKHNGKFWKRDKVRESLVLTPQEVQDLEQIFDKAQPALIQYELEVKRGKAAVDKAFVDDGVADEQVLTQVDSLESARTKLARARLLMLREMRRVLTPAQRDALARLHD